MKKLLLLPLAALFAQEASAVSPTEKFLVGSDLPHVSTTSQPESLLSFSVPTSAPISADAAECDVTIRFGLDGEDIEPAIVNFYDANGNVLGVRSLGAMSASTTLPAGRYDALCLFECNSSRSRFPERSTIWVVKENIEVTPDCEVKFDVAEVQEPIKVRPVHADGSEITVDKTTRNADGGYDVIESGNAVAVLHRVVLYADGKTTMMSGGGSYSDITVAGEYSKRGFDPVPAFDIWINPLSNRFKMGVMRMVVNNDCVEVIGMPVNEIKPGTISNDPADYFTETSSFVHTPAYDKRTQEYDFPCEITSRIDMPGLGGHYLEAKTVEGIGHNVKICVGKEDPYQYGVQFGLMDRIDIRHVKEEIIPGYFYEHDEDYSEGIYSPWGFVENGTLNYAPAIYDVDRAAKTDYPGPLPHTYTNCDNKSAFGQGVPFTQLTFGSTSRGGVINPYLTTHSVGLSGELRSSDNADVYMSILVDGQQALSETINTIPKWQRTLDFAKATPKKIEISLQHDNAKAGDINGRSSMKAIVNFADGKDSDYFPPVINSIQVRGEGNIISQTIDRADAGEISIYAGDFNQVFGDEIPSGSLERHYVYAPVSDIEVECALHGSDEFVALPVEAIGDADPIYGQLYTSSLSSIDNKGCWFDIRITLTDEAGNKQVQNIAPAFFISSTSGIASINSDGNGIFHVEGRSIIADRDDTEIFSVSGTRVDGRNLMPGVYIVRAGSSSAKTVIK